MPINPEACAGPCNSRARDAWQSYDQAVVEHDIAMEFYADAYARYQADVEAWRVPLAWPAEPSHPVQPEPPSIPVSIANPIWCGRCPRIIRGALAELDDTAALLAAKVDGYRGAAISGPNGVKPLDHTAIIEALDELYGDLVDVEDKWRAARRYPSRPQRARGAHARMVTIGWLQEQLDDILLDPWSVEVGLNVLRWQRRLRQMAKSDPASRRSPIRCPRCRERQVTRRDDGFYECGCGRLLNQSEHDREYAEQAAEHDHEQQEAHA
jgi:ribosomal protein L37AE/L43A